MIAKIRNDRVLSRLVGVVGSPQLNDGLISLKQVTLKLLHTLLKSLHLLLRQRLRIQSFLQHRLDFLLLRPPQQPFSLHPHQLLTVALHLRLGLPLQTLLCQVELGHVFYLLSQALGFNLMFFLALTQLRFYIGEISRLFDQLFSDSCVVFELKVHKPLLEQSVAPFPIPQQRALVLDRALLISYDGVVLVHMP